MPVRQLMYSPLPMGEARVPMYRVCHYATTPVKIVTSTINPVLPVIRAGGGSNAFRHPYRVLARGSSFCFDHVLRKRPYILADVDSFS
ncbi:MAG: hypothetical protein NVS4B2_35610 [Chloroflexota bacterium]